MAKNRNAGNTSVQPIRAHDPDYWLCEPDCPGPHLVDPAQPNKDAPAVAVSVLILGLVSLGLWPLGPVAVWFGILACRERHGLRGRYLWMALGGLLAGLVATLGLAVLVVAKLTLHFV